MFIVIILGIICEIIGMRSLFSFIKQKVNCTETVMGKIVDKSIGDEINEQYPIYEYTIDGKTYVKQSKIRESSVPLGIKIKIYYNPNNPDEFFAYGDYSIFSIIMTGGLFTLVGLYVIINCFIYYKDLFFNAN